MTLTNTTAVALTPKAGAHGELLGMMAIKAAQEARGQGHRNIVLVPDSAHGTNPATAAFLGYTVKSDARPAPTAPSMSRRSRPRSAPTSRRSC